VEQVSNLFHLFSLFPGVARDMGDSSEKVEQVSNLFHLFSLFPGVARDMSDSFQFLRERRQSLLRKGGTG
jgi:hypothetical protein